MNCEDCGHAVRHHPHPCEPDRPGEGMCIVCDCRRYVAPKVAAPDTLPRREVVELLERALVSLNQGASYFSGSDRFRYDSVRDDLRVYLRKFGSVFA